MKYKNEVVPGASHPKSVHQIELVCVARTDNATPQRYEIGVPGGDTQWGLWFQSKPCQGVEDVDGLTNEVLLLAIINRLEFFQDGKMACEENEQALMFCRGALESLRLRTENRASEGVEGSHEVHTTGQGEAPHCGAEVSSD